MGATVLGHNCWVEGGGLLQRASYLRFLFSSTIAFKLSIKIQRIFFPLEIRKMIFLLSSNLVKCVLKAFNFVL